MATMAFSTTAMLLLAMITFLAAAYSLHLYTTSQHGPLSLFSNPLNLFTQRNYVIIMLHLIPATVLTLKADTILTWSV